MFYVNINITITMDIVYQYVGVNINVLTHFENQSILNKTLCMFVCMFGLENSWMDFDDSFLYLLTMDPEEVIVNFDV